MNASTYTKSGTKASVPQKLDKNIFEQVPKNHELLKSAYLAYLANGRQNLAKTLKRGEVRGGGRKPWKQKGTGRARFGSIRNPIWRGGGITFGPSGNENHTISLPTKAKRLAIRQALSLAAKSGKVVVVDTFSTMGGKTKDMSAFLKKIEANGKVLCVISEKNPEKIRATQNIPDLKVVSAKYLNVYDTLNSDKIIISKKSLDIISEWLGPAKAEVKA